jgi:hypothetical protein
VKERTEPLTDNEKAEAVLNMMSYCIIQQLPLPEQISTVLSWRIGASTSMWSFQAKLEYIEGEEYDSPERKARQNAWMKEWISNIAKHAANDHPYNKDIKITKEWDSHLTIVITSDVHHWEIRYSVMREAVCQKVVTGKKHIEEHIIPARDEEIVEWVCNDKSLLGDD